jgi:hypothetical protein
MQHVLTFIDMWDIVDNGKQKGFCCGRLSLEIVDWEWIIW